MDTTKLTAFAQAVGADIKEVKQSVSTKVETSAMNQAISQAVTQAKSEVKAEILGEGTPENLDTLKEIATMIASMSGDTEGAVVQKLADLGRRIDEFTTVDLVETYNNAKE
ncbi:hypothetical protein SP4011_10600 [Streptococcus parapneumoniae]|uniref:Phage protein n=1 Tax=Streptococcus parapneumoniae TaxID=2993430 RepID=A0ABN6TK17_9STRE|nr:hypothetical protein SP4011_10600 [Streptococcus sp. SP4011]